jgi:hypothetical protein
VVEMDITGRDDTGKECVGKPVVKRRGEDFCLERKWSCMLFFNKMYVISMS